MIGLNSTSFVSWNWPFSMRERSNRDLLSFTIRPRFRWISSISSSCPSVQSGRSANNSSLFRQIANGVWSSWDAFSMNCFCWEYISSFRRVILSIVSFSRRNSFILVGLSNGRFFPPRVNWFSQFNSL